MKRIPPRELNGGNVSSFILHPLFSRCWFQLWHSCDQVTQGNMTGHFCIFKLASWQPIIFFSVLLKKKQILLIWFFVTGIQNTCSPNVSTLSIFSIFCQFCTAALEHSASGVREVAMRIILSMYRQHKAAVLGFLPPSDAAQRKFFLYKTLFDGFAKIDGKLVETQASVAFSLQSHCWLKTGLSAFLSACLSVCPRLKSSWTHLWFYWPCKKWLKGV